MRILTPQAGTEAVTRVMIESADKTGERWSTVGVSANIIDASYNALNDAHHLEAAPDVAWPPGGMAVHRSASGAPPMPA